MAKDAINGGFNDDTLRQVESILDTMPDVVEEILESAAQEVVLEMKDRIFNKGLRANGAIIGTYTDGSIAKKKQRLEDGKNVDADIVKKEVSDTKVRLVESGSFRDSLKIEEPSTQDIKNLSIGIRFTDNTSNKQDEILAKYGDNVFAFSQKEIELATEIINEEISIELEELFDQLNSR